MKYFNFFLIFFLLVGCVQDVHRKTGLEGKPMPSFDLLLMDSVTHLNTKNIPEGQPIVLLFISPSCPYCRSQTKEIISNIALFQNVRFYILSTYPFQSLKQYYQEFGLNKYRNITVGGNYDLYFVRAFKVDGIPYMAFYSRNKILKQVMIGKLDVGLVRDIALE
jgi:thioredoxin-related protein